MANRQRIGESTRLSDCSLAPESRCRNVIPRDCIAHAKTGKA